MGCGVLARRLYHARASVLFADVFDHQQLRGDVLVTLAGLLADGVQVLMARRAVFFFRRQIVLDPFALQVWRQPMPSSRAAFFLVLTVATGRAGRQIVFVLFCWGFRWSEFGRVELDNAELLRE